MNEISIAPDFSSWQIAARHAAQREWPPDQIRWDEADPPRPSPVRTEQDYTAAAHGDRKLFVPKRFVKLARLVAMHSEPQRWALLYRLLWRLTHGEAGLMGKPGDPEIQRAVRMEKAVRHEIHRMRADVRFSKLEVYGDKWFVAWFEPGHHIVEHNAAFFCERFGRMNWSLLTPDLCAHSKAGEVRFSSGTHGVHGPSAAEVEKLWLRCHKDIFNPADIKVHASNGQMPNHYCDHLPQIAGDSLPSKESESPDKSEERMRRTRNKQAADPASDWRPAPAPDSSSLKVVRDASKICTACPLYRNATQTVFGEGPKDAAMMLVGEQPGDQEDVAGKPFVGPAGHIMDRGLVEAGINRREVYVTNAVKHFKWEPRGKRRIHQKPNSRDIAACRPWLEAELRIVRPKLVVAMGATAAQTLLGPGFRVTKQRGKVVSADVGGNHVRIVATVHPSSLLRQPDEESREREYKLFVADLKAAVKAANAG